MVWRKFKSPYFKGLLFEVNGLVWWNCKQSKTKSSPASPTAERDIEERKRVRGLMRIESRLVSY